MIISLIALVVFLIFYLNEKNKKSNNNVQNNFNNRVNSGYNNVNNKENTIYDNINTTNINSNLSNNIIRKKKNVNISLNLGVGLIILSSIIFATTTWNSVSDLLKVFILLFETLLFFGLGMLLKKKFNIQKTSDALIFISSILCGIVFLSVGYFKLLGYSFSLFGNYKNLFIFTTFIIETIVFLVRKYYFKSKSYFFILCFLLASMFFLSQQITNDFIFSFSMISLLLILINLFKVDLFLENQKSFDNLNVILTSVLSFEFIISCFYVFLKDSSSFIQKIPLMLQLIVLFLNLFISLSKKNNLRFLSILYEGFLIFIYICLSRSLVNASYFLLVTSIIIYLIYYFSNEKTLKNTSIIYSYLQGFLSIVLICFNEKLTITASVISLIFIILSILSISKEKLINNIFNYIMQLLFTITLVISFVLSIKSLDILNSSNVILIINFIILIYFVINNLLKNKIKKLYIILLTSGLFIQTIVSYDIIYIIIVLILSLILYVYTFIYKKEFNDKISYYISLQFIFTCVFGLNNYALISFVITLLSLLMLLIINKNDKKRYLYISLLYIPLLLILDINPFNLSLATRNYISVLSVVPSVLVFTRNLIKKEKETLMNILEFIIFTISLFYISSYIFLVIYLLVLILCSYLLNNKYKNSSKLYLNYLIFIIPFLCLDINNVKYRGLILTVLTSIYIINQIIYILIHSNRNKILEIIHSVLSFILIIVMVNSLGLSPFISCIIATILLFILYFIYSNKKTKYLSLCYLIYPLNLLINSLVINGDINRLLINFSFILPISLFIRKVLELKEKNQIAIEIISLSFMFLLNIFNIDLAIAIILGIISGLLIFVGHMLKYKELKYLGYIALGALVIIQTAYLWQKFFWLIFLLIFGIILVVIAIYNESKKK